MWNPFKKKSNKVTLPTPGSRPLGSVLSGATVAGSSYGTINITSGAYAGIATSGVTMGPMTIAAPVYTIGSSSDTKLISFFKSNGDPLVVLNRDGSVTWPKEIEVNEGAKAFSTMLTLGSESKAGVTEGVKRRMRDLVFEEIIQMARERGALTADDLTFMLQSSKIIEKLKGPNE